ncbi:MAG TPA: hypothetical protein VGH28_09590 [Polyangiaceae bacterium]|jgi:MYXO-CTERM domain-containing protein
MRPRNACIAVVALAAACLIPEPARAFTVGSVGTSGCHETITEAALRDVRGAFATAKPIAPSTDEEAMIADLPFSVPDDMRDLAAASLLVGVRDNDLKGRSPAEFDQLAIIQADPTTQREHCLRGPGDDEPNGSQTAIANCEQFIDERVAEALSALDASGAPDPNARVEISVWLSLRERVTVALPTFWVRIGQAMHALQDSFAHTYRTADGARVTTVLNWVDWANGQLVESRDGPPHKMVMDQCDDDDPILTRNRLLATQASTDFLRAALDPSTSTAQKTAAVDQVLAKYIDYSPGCTAQNDWCDAAENAFPASCGCHTVGAARTGLAGFAAFVLVALLARRRRRARWLAVPFALALFAIPRDAHAEPRFAISANAGGSIADPAFAQSLGLRIRLGRHFILGADGELEEWFDINGARIAPGVACFYATGILRFPMNARGFDLRTTFQLGAAYELVQLEGVPSGSSGPFFGVYPLGLAWRLGRHLTFTFDPLGVAVPVPHLRGTPFAYPQFRSQLGFEIGL